MKNKPAVSLHCSRHVFAKNMRIVRRLRDISQENLAFDANVSRVYICDVEKAKRAVSIDVMGRIADALDVHLSDLLKDDLPLSNYHKKQ